MTALSNEPRLTKRLQQNLRITPLAAVQVSGLVKSGRNRELNLILSLQRSTKQKPELRTSTIASWQSRSGRNSGNQLQLIRKQLKNSLPSELKQQSMY